MNESKLATTWAGGSLLLTVVHSDGILFLFYYVSFYMDLFLVANYVQGTWLLHKHSQVAMQIHYLPLYFDDIFGICGATEIQSKVETVLLASLCYFSFDHIQIKIPDGLGF